MKLFVRPVSVALAIASLILVESGCGNAETDAVAKAGAAPTVGSKAPAFPADSELGKTHKLEDLLKTGPLVVVQLRGWVGYQCPVCSRQFGDLLAHAGDFAAKNAQIVFVYPGPAEGLDAHAKEFLSGKEMPKNFLFANDPDLVFVKAWGLRWEKIGETAYPATFVVDKTGKITFAKVSEGHGGRASSMEILDALAKK